MKAWLQISAPALLQASKDKKQKPLEEETKKTADTHTQREELAERSEEEWVVGEGQGGELSAPDFSYFL